ncbi:hypothetical protein WA026_022884, partial [Henosepilachna vigintioctopunctata]
KLRDLQRDLCEEDSYGVYNVNDANEKYAIFLGIFCLYCDKHIPMKCMNTTRENKPSQEERHMTETLDLMREAYEQINNKYTRSTISSEVLNNLFVNMGQNITKEIQTTSENSYSYLANQHKDAILSPFEGNLGI